MLKKLFVAFAMLTATTGAAIADPAPYLGASIGILNNTSTGVRVPTGPNTFVSNPGFYRGVPFNLFAGYGGVINQNFYLAGEVFGTAATAEINDKNKLKTTYGYGASLIPGVLLSDHTLAYGRIGVVRSQFSEAKSNSNGAQFGFGLQTCLTQNIDLRAEYDFTAYKSVGLVSSPRQDAVNVGLVYKFD